METKTYRGRSLDEILPRIKADLGPDAVITRQRNGLTGGVGGFFQRECIEVEASPAARRFDAYDEDPPPEQFAEEPEAAEQFVPDELPADAATSEGLSSRAIQEMLSQAAPFAEHLSLAETSVDAPQPPPAAPPEEVEPPARPPQADKLERSLVEAGLSPSLAAEVVTDTATHVLPFASSRSLKRLVRAGLARRIPVEPGATGASRALAFVGPAGAGKTLCCARVAAAYSGAGTLPVVCVALRAADGGAELRALLEPLGVPVFGAANGPQARALVEPERERAAVIVDTPAVAATDRAAIAELAADLAEIGLGEVHLTLPATISAPAARELIEALEPLGASRITLTHSDASSHVGGLIDAVIAGATPVSYVARGSELPGGLEPASADALAGMVVA